MKKKNSVWTFLENPADYNWIIVIENKKSQGEIRYRIKKTDYLTDEEAQKYASYLVNLLNNGES